MQTIHVGAEQLRRELADLLSRVSYAGDRIVVERHGTPQAVLISYTFYNELIEQKAEPAAPPMTEEEFAQHLVDKGLVRPRDAAATARISDDWEPVPIQGKPLSEIIIEERR